MTRFWLPVTALVALGGCAAASRQPPAQAAAVDHRLPWTAANVEAVGRKCHIEGLDITDRGLMTGGLHTIGQKSDGEVKWECLQHNIQVPPSFIFVEG